MRQDWIIERKDTKLFATLFNKYKYSYVNVHVAQSMKLSAHDEQHRFQSDVQLGVQLYVLLGIYGHNCGITKKKLPIKCC